MLHKINFRNWQLKISQGQVSGIDRDGDHYALVKYDPNWRSGVAGCAGEGACSRSPSRRTSANRYMGEDLLTAIVSQILVIVLTTFKKLFLFRSWFMKLVITSGWRMTLMEINQGLQRMDHSVLVLDR